MTGKAIQGRAFANVSLLFFFALWLALFAWRKTFSYVNVGGVYVIELMAVTGLWVFAHAVLVRPRLSFAVPRDARIKMALSLAAMFVAYNLVRAALSQEVSAKGLIPGIYPAYFVLALIIATNADDRVVRLVSRALVWMFFLTPLVMYFNVYIIAPRFGPIEDPGATYVYAVAMMLALVLIRNRLASFALFGTYFAFSVLQFERATFVNAGIAAVVLFLASGSNAKRALARLYLVKTVIFVALLMIVTPIAVGLLFNAEGGRFLVTSGNLMKFFSSVIGGGVELGLGGTREHRLEMWAEIIRMVSSTPLTFLFGLGYAGEIGEALDISFRAPHNGFLTILFRGGIIGLALFGCFLFSLYDTLRRTLRSTSASAEAKREATIGLLVLGALIGDTLTGTILDSPFTSWLFYVQIAIVCVRVYRLRRASALAIAGAQPRVHGVPKILEVP